LSFGELRARGITLRIARRGTVHGLHLGGHRWVIKRSFAWLHAFKRLRTPLRTPRRHPPGPALRHRATGEM